MQPKYSQAAFDAFATQQGLDEEYRQKLAMLMGVQPVSKQRPNPYGLYAPGNESPMLASNTAEREVIDLDQWQSAQNARAIDLDAPPVIDLDAQAPREVIDMDAWQRSQDARVIDLDAPPVIDLDAPRQPVSVSFDRKPTSFSRERPVIDLDAPQSGVRKPISISTGISELDKARAAAAGVVDQNAIPPLEKWRGGTTSGAATSGMLKGLVGNAQEAQRGLKSAYKGVEEAQVASFDPAIKSNAAMAQNQRDIGAVQNYEARLMEQRVQEFNAKKAEIDSSIKREQDRLMGMDPLDPKRAWNQASFGGKIALAIGAMLSGFAGPEVLKQYNEQIFGKDFEAQKLAYEKQKGNVDMQTNRYAMLMNQLKDDAAVRAAYFAPIYKALESKAGEIAATGGSEQARANARNAQEHFRLEGAKAETVAAQGTLTAAMKAAGSAAGAVATGEGSKQNPYVLNEKMKADQERISKKLVKTTRGIFEAPNETNRGQYEEQLNGAFKLTDAVENARALAEKTSAFEGVGNKLTTDDYAALKSAVSLITGAYAKSEALGALDKNLQELMASITGDMFNVGRVRMLLGNLGNTARRNVAAYMDKYTLKPLHAAYARDPMYGNSITQVWVPGGYSQKAMSPLDISQSKVQGPGE